jgi:hypothetical protein
MKSARRGNPAKEIQPPAELFSPLPPSLPLSLVIEGKENKNKEKKYFQKK